MLTLYSLCICDEHMDDISLYIHTYIRIRIYSVYVYNILCVLYLAHSGSPPITQLASYFWCCFYTDNYRLHQLTLSVWITWLLACYASQCGALLRPHVHRVTLKVILALTLCCSLKFQEAYIKLYHSCDRCNSKKSSPPQHCFVFLQ